MDDLETKLAEYKPNSLEVGLKVGLDIAGSVLRFPIDYVVGFLPNEVRLKLFKSDKKKNERSFSSNTITQLIAGVSAVVYGLVEQWTYEKLYGPHFYIYAAAIAGIGLSECAINSIRMGCKDNVGHPLFTIPYHFLKKRYSAQKQKLIEEHNSKIITAENQLLLEDKAGSLSHPDEIENQGMLSLQKYTANSSYDDEEHF